MWFFVLSDRQSFTLLPSGVFIFIEQRAKTGKGELRTELKGPMSSNTAGGDEGFNPNYTFFMPILTLPPELFHPFNLSALSTTISLNGLYRWNKVFLVSKDEFIAVQLLCYNISHCIYYLKGSSRSKLRIRLLSTKTTHTERKSKYIW